MRSRDRRAGAHDPERALDLACERLVQSIAAAERLRGELRARRGRAAARRRTACTVTTEMLGEGVLVFDLHGRAIYANNAAARILSCQPRPAARPPRRATAAGTSCTSDGSPLAGRLAPGAATLQTGRSSRS